MPIGQTFLTDAVTCILCGTQVKGGIKRLKQHLAGGYADVKICESEKLTTEIRKEMGQYLRDHKRRRHLFLCDEEDGDLCSCNSLSCYC